MSDTGNSRKISPTIRSKLKIELTFEGPEMKVLKDMYSQQYIHNF